MGVPLSPDGTWAPLKLQAMSKIFQYYKFKNIVLEIYPSTSNQPVNIDFGYATQEVVTPGSLASVIELPWSATYSSLLETMPRKFRVNLQHGNNQLKRFDTVPSTSGDPNLQVQGQLYFSAPKSGAYTIKIYIHGTCEFSGFVDTGLPELFQNPQDDEKVLESDSPLVVGPISPPAQVSGFYQRRPSRVIVAQLPMELLAKSRQG